LRACLIVAVTACAASAQSFEVASVRLSASVNGLEGSGRPSLDVAADRLILRNHKLLDCIRWAYEVQEYQVAGPDGMYAEKYEITGKAAGPVSRAELRLMLRSLLEERFKLSLHREQKEIAVFAMVVTKNGAAKLKPRESAAGEVSRERGMKVLGPGLKVSFTRQPLSDLAGFLSTLIVVGRPVLDRSGLTGLYSFELDLNEAAKPGTEDRPSVSTVLQEQLGLKLEGIRSPIEVLVIDHMEKPSGN
jgi:uncharacterized protein (TIGR03435 family)